MRIIHASPHLRPRASPQPRNEGEGWTLPSSWLCLLSSLPGRPSPACLPPATWSREDWGNYSAHWLENAKLSLWCGSLFWSVCPLWPRMLGRHGGLHKPLHSESPPSSLNICSRASNRAEMRKREPMFIGYLLYGRLHAVQFYEYSRLVWTATCSLKMSWYPFQS